MPRITVITSTYNRSRILRCALHSLCHQSFTDFEAWVVGDCCTDDSDRVVAGFGDPRLHWANLPRRVGSQCGPNNEALRRARGEYIAYLGHDDLWFPWHLASALQAIEQTGSDFVYAGAALVGPDGAEMAQGAPGQRRVSAYRTPAPPAAWLHRREIVAACGMWPDPAFEIGGTDVGFQRRIFLAGRSFASSARLSVLKFPSHWWRTYDLDEGFPQERYLAEMLESSDKLYEQVLAELVFSYVRRQETPASFTESLHSARIALQNRFLDWYGAERWPLSRYLLWRHHSQYRRKLSQRGLPTPHDPD